jgi:AraC-like DNA-binding protein
MEVLMGTTDSVFLKYREVAPPIGLAHLVFCFFEFIVDGVKGGATDHEITPDGFVSVLIKKNPPVAEHGILLVRGLSLESFHARVEVGDIHWGFRVAPAANRLVLGTDPARVPTMPLFDQNVLPHVCEALGNRFKEINTFEEAVNASCEFLFSLEISEESVDPFVAKAVSLVRASRGDVKVAEMAELLGVNRRRLERSFRKEVDMSVKQYARVFRLRSTAISMIQEDELNWANRAAEMGFSDQSHLIKEFIALTGRTPKGFSTGIERISYGDLIT